MSADKELAKLFAGSVTPLDAIKRERGRDFGFYALRLFALFNVGFIAFQVTGLVFGLRGIELIDRLFLNPPQTAITLSKEALMLTVALIAAFNKSLRRPMLVVLVAGHVVAVGAQLWLYLAYAPNRFFPGDRDFLLTGIISDAVVIMLSVVLFLLSPEKSEERGDLDDLELRSPASTIYKYALFITGAACLLYAIAIVLLRMFAPATSAPGAVFGAPDPLVANSVTRYGALAIIFFLAGAKASLRRFMIPAALLSLLIGSVSTVLFAAFGLTAVLTRAGATYSAGRFMWAQTLFDGGLFALVLLLRRMHYQVDYQITSLTPSSAECIMASHESLREAAQNPESSSREVLHRLDEHIAGIRGRRRGLLAFPFWLLEQVFPIITGLRPPFSTQSREERRWMLRRYVICPPFERHKLVPRFISNFMAQIGDVVHSLTSIVYFTTARGQGQVGYVLPDARVRLQPDIATARPPIGAQVGPLPCGLDDPAGKKPLSAADPARTLIAPAVAVPRAAGDDRALPDEVDYCIIGSGAAGAVMAYRLAESVGESNSICVLERGAHNSPARDFSDDELRMIRTLYAEGGLQMSRTFDFTVLQGETVGGSTVINNAICIKMPEATRREWAEHGINLDSIEAHYERVKGEINIAELDANAVNRSVEALFRRGVSGYNAGAVAGGALEGAQVLSGNFLNCVGCGLCNIGCRRMRKLSALETYLPWAEARGVVIHSNLDAVKCETQSAREGGKRVTSVLVRRQGGEFKRVRVRKAAILAGGAIASSRFLMRSGLGGAGVGKRLSCNYALPTLVEFDETVDAFDGLQITMFAAPESYEAIFETTYNPPGAYSISLPLHFGEHFKMMSAYRNGVNFGALVGSDPCGEVRKSRDLMFGRAIEWEPTAGDIEKVKGALATLVKMGREAGGNKITLPTRPALVIPLRGGVGVEAVLDEFGALLKERKDFNFVTAHPQGGNMMAGPGTGHYEERVVEVDFRVRGTENLFVCDASVFPTGARVNPQWTIMALASIASESVVKRFG